MTNVKPQVKNPKEGYFVFNLLGCKVTFRSISVLVLCNNKSLIMLLDITKFVGYPETCD